MSYWSMTFPGTADNLREVRRFTRGMLRDVPGTSDVVQVASELAANAILHSASGEPGGTFTMHLATYPNQWQVRMDDGGGLTSPRMLPRADGDIGSGGGLALVAALSRTWDVLGDDYGRAVWAEVMRPEA